MIRKKCTILESSGIGYTANPYDQDYFENGIVLGNSLYENYRWLPELTMRTAHFLIKKLEIEEKATVLDFGCAKGYLVKALRLLGIQAYGCDISDYAIGMVDAEVKPYCRLSSTEEAIPFSGNWHFDWVIAKDVFEHLPQKTLLKILKDFHHFCKRIFVVVPLGENERFLIPEYEKDTTHILAKNSQWWRQTFRRTGWMPIEFCHQMKGLKENWARRYPEGNGLYTLVSVPRGELRVEK